MRKIDPETVRQGDALSRRSMLLQTGVGLGAIAAAGILAPQAIGVKGTPPIDTAEGPAKGVLGTGHYPARAKRVLFINMYGAVSQVDTFDYKPTLIRMGGQQIPPTVKNRGGRVSAMSNAQASFPLVPPLAEFKQHGQSGAWASGLVPYMGSIADELCFIRTMNTEHVNHDPAAKFLHTGFQLSGRPSAGAWVDYALGTDNANLPSFVVLNSKGTAAQTVDAGAWGPGFLPSHHQGVQFMSGQDPVLYVGNPGGVTVGDRRAELDVIGELSKVQHRLSNDPEILSKLSQYEMAYRMQDSIPQISDLSDEPQHILDMYGPDVRRPGSFARNCLLARRLLEHNVKYVQVIHAAWDHHTNIARDHPIECRTVDQPSAALVMDLKQRGLLEDTLVVWGSEFGRTSFAQGAISGDFGRDHHGGCFTMWMAGAGVKAGYTHGETDDFSYNITKDAVSIHDLHATMLYLLGIDHKQLTFHYQGRDFRLTDVHGEIIKPLIA